MELKDIREKLDELDSKLLDLVNKRASLSLEVGREKMKTGQPVLDENREKNILARLIDDNPGPLSKESVTEIFKKIIAENRILEQKNSSQ